MTIGRTILFLEGLMTVDDDLLMIDGYGLMMVDDGTVNDKN